MSTMDFSSATEYASHGDQPEFEVEYLKLKMNEEEKKNLLTAAIHRSDERVYDYVYNTMSYNCTTELFNLMDYVLKYPVAAIRPFAISILKMRDPAAGPSEEALVKRQLIQKKSDGSLPIVWGPYNGTLQHQ